jgi:hypothetical protein
MRAAWAADAATGHEVGRRRMRAAWAADAATGDETWAAARRSD